MLAGVGEAQYAHTASFVLCGAMLLFLATTEKGGALKPRRVKLLLLFFALLLGSLGLPVLDWLQLLVLPLLLRLYYPKGAAPFAVLAALAEAGGAVMRALEIMPGALGPNPLFLRGLGLAALYAVRGLVALRLFLCARAAAKTEAAAAHEKPDNAL